MRIFFTSLIAILLLSSCKVMFTDSLRKRVENNQIELNNIQFYNSQFFVLQRELSSEETGIDKGKVKTHKGVKVEIIKIYAKTPAICDFVTKDTLYLIFEFGDNRRIPFVYNTSHDRYGLITNKLVDEPLEIDTYSSLQSFNIFGSLYYDDKEYYYGYIKKPFLLVKNSQVQRIIKEYRTLKGVKIK